MALRRGAKRKRTLSTGHVDVEEECDSECPLRKPYEPHPDPPLPPVPATTFWTRDEACQQIYTPIQEWQTRLVVLEPGTFGTGLTAMLAVVDVVYMPGVILHDQQQRVQYMALSYTWGAATFPRRIDINNIEFPITENLYAFFQRFRDPNTRLYMWVDALCINQLDPIEKATQVSNIVDIYEKAQEAFIWLGEESMHTKLAAEYLRWSTRDVLDSQIQKFSIKRHSETCWPLFTQVMAGIEDICSRDWVRRIWVKQEVWAATKLIVRCGTSNLSWNGYKHCGNVTLQPPVGSVRPIRTHGGIVEPCKPRLIPEHTSCLQSLRSRTDPPPEIPSYDIEVQGEVEMLRLLNRSTACQYSNSHDRIYALLAMAEIKRSGDQLISDHHTRILTVDYTITLEKLFQNLAKSIMLELGAYSILATDGTFWERSGLNLPSWVPDFRHAVHGRLDYPFRPTVATVHRKSDDLSLTAEHVQLRFRELNAKTPSDVLMLEGFRIAEITGPVLAPRLIRSIIARRQEDGSTASMEDFPFLKSMACETMSSIEKSYSSFHRLTMLFDRLPLGFTNFYLQVHGAFAVPLEAEKGDWVAVVGTMGVPIVLRAVVDCPGRFHFIGCAWLFAADDASLEYSIDPFWTGISEEFRSVFAEYNPPCEDETGDIRYMYAPNPGPKPDREIFEVV